MTKQEIDFKRAVEEQRHNLATEALGEGQLEEARKGRIAKTVGDVISIAKTVAGAKLKGNKTDKSVDLSGYGFKADDRNDAAWWNNAPGEKAGARFSTDYPITGLLDPESSGHKITETSVVIIPFMPVLGGRRQQKYFNYQLDQLFQRARQDNTSSPAYTKADIGKLLLSADSIHLLMAHIGLVLRLATKYTETNRLHTRNILAALVENMPNTSSTPISASTVVINGKFAGLAEALPGLEARYNVLVDVLNEWNIPNSYPFMINHIWMVSRLFAGGANVRSEWYLYKPTHVYRYYNDGRLVLDDLDTQVGANASIEGYIRSLLMEAETLYSAIATAEFAQLVTGDFAKPKMFGTERSHYISIPHIDVSDSIDVAYDPEALSRIQNLRPVTYGGMAKTKPGAGQFNIVERTNGQLVQGFRALGTYVAQPAAQMAMTTSGAGFDVEGFTFFIAGTGNETNDGNPPATPLTNTGVFSVLRPALFGKTGQLSEDDILVGTRAMCNVSFGEVDFIIQNDASEPVYRSASRGAFITDCGCELYGFPRIVTAEMSSPATKLRIHPYLPVLSQGSSGDQMRVSAAIISQCEHGPKPVCVEGWIPSGPGLADLGDFYASSYGAFPTTPFQLDYIGAFEAATPVPQNNLTWCHNTAIMSAFKSSFWR